MGKSIKLILNQRRYIYKTIQWGKGFFFSSINGAGKLFIMQKNKIGEGVDNYN